MTLSITISAGQPVTDIEPGVYEVVLTDLEGPRPIYPQTGPNAGKEVLVYDWTFALDHESDATIQGTTSTASGPKSKLFAWLTALLGGKPPLVGTTFTRDLLVGRSAVATISVNEGGWPRIDNLSALPARRAAPQPAAPAPAPAPQRPQPAATVAVNGTAPDDELPF